MKVLSGIMSKENKEAYLESCRARYPSRNRQGKSRMIDEVSDVFGWDRKHTIKTLNGKVNLGSKAKKRGTPAIYGEAEQVVIVELWKLSEQPCGKRLKATLPVWINSYEKHYGALTPVVKAKVLKCSPRQLDRITAPHKLHSNRKGRETGRTSHRLKKLIPIKCGPQDIEQPGYFEVDTVSHGGGSSSGEFLHTLTMTDIYSGWTELRGLWGNRGSEVCAELNKIETALNFDLLGFDSDNGSEFLNETLERYPPRA